jgi:hypothetical protein
MLIKIVSNRTNLIPALISIFWSFFVVLQFFTSIPNLDQNNKLEGSGMFIIGLLILSIIVCVLTLLWIIISNIINKIKFYIDIQYSLMILLIWTIAILVK